MATGTGGKGGKGRAGKGAAKKAGAKKAGAKKAGAKTAGAKKAGAKKAAGKRGAGGRQVGVQAIERAINDTLRNVRDSARGGAGSDVERVKAIELLTAIQSLLRAFCRSRPGSGRFFSTFK